MVESRMKILGEMKIEKALIYMGLPSIVGMMVNAIYNIVDAIFIGKLGTVYQAATNIVFPFFMIIGAIGLTFGIGAASYISRLLGEKNIEEANKTVSTAFFSSVITGLIVTIITLIFMKEILFSFGATKTNIEYAISYGSILAFGSIFTMLNMTMNNMLRAEGSAKISMISLCLGAVLNIILDPIFIFVLNLGINGAAIATVLSQMISTIVLLSYYLRHKSILRISFKYITINKKIYSEIMKIGMPTLIRQLLASLAIALTNNFANIYGDYAIASIGIVNRIYMLVFYVMVGFSQGFQPIAGYSFGAKNTERLKNSIKVAIRWSSVYCIIMTTIFFVFTYEIVKLFSDDPSVIELSMRALKALSIMLPFSGFMIIINSLFQAIGHGIKAALLSLARQGIFLLPTLLILPRIYKLTGIIYAQTVADFFTMVLTVLISMEIIKEIYLKNEIKKSIY